MHVLGKDRAKFWNDPAKKEDPRSLVAGQKKAGPWKARPRRYRSDPVLCGERRHVSPLHSVSNSDPSTHCIYSVLQNGHVEANVATVCPGSTATSRLCVQRITSYTEEGGEGCCVAGSSLRSRAPRRPMRYMEASTGRRAAIGVASQRPGLDHRGISTQDHALAGAMPGCPVPNHSGRADAQARVRTASAIIPRILSTSPLRKTCLARPSTPGPLIGRTPKPANRVARPCHGSPARRAISGVRI